MLLGCTGEPAPLEGGALVAATHECARCHSAPGVLTEEPQARNCVGCHQAIFAGAFDETHRPEGVARWKENVRSLRYAPSLVGVGRLRADWLDNYLSSPHDLRPGLPASMPRLTLDAGERQALVSWLGADTRAVTTHTRGDPDAGLALMEARGCGSCHVYSGSGTLADPPPESVASILAPDLRHARERLSAETLLAWLDDPAALKADTLMPAPGLSAAERDDVAAALLRAPLAAPAAHAVPERLPPLSQPVSFFDVEEAVFHKVCWHCHSDPDGNNGDGGPGNTGGLGYGGVGLDLGTREGVLRGMCRADGTCRSVLEGDPPLLVEAMRRRHQELAGQPAARPGMPLGLPPMTAEQIQLVDTWIQQGAPP